MLPEPDAIARAYESTRSRFLALVDGGGEAIAETVVPATPAWTVRQVVTHMAGVCEDILAGRLDGVASDAWTGAQIERHDGDDLVTVAALWAELGPQIDAVVPVIPPLPASQLVFDAYTHEQDVRAALAVPGGRTAEATAVPLGFLLGTLDGFVRAKALGALRIETPEMSWTLGDGAPAVTLRADGWEIVRALGGRRSDAQIRALGWDGDPSPYLTMYRGAPISPPAADLVE